MYFAGEVLRQVQSAGREDVDRAVESAKEAFHEWSILSGFQRGQILKKAADIIRVKPILKKLFVSCNLALTSSYPKTSLPLVRKGKPGFPVTAIS